MRTLWRKAVRDFWNERMHAAMVVLAIAAGVAGFSAVMSSYAILVRELDRGYLETNPASATLYTDSVDRRLLDAIKANTPVSAAEARRAVRGRIKVGTMEWKTLYLFVVEDYGDIRVSVLKPQRGAWPPKTGEILIERDALQVAHTQIGERVTVRVEGAPRELRVTGSVHDVGQAQARMENWVYGYINLETLALLGEKPYLDQIKILVAENRLDEAHVNGVAERVKQFVESLGHPVTRMDVPRPGKHPHADLMGMLLLSISSFGVFILILSGILVVNLLTASMAAQVRQIGVMKAVGGTRWQIMRIYFAQALLLGVAAVVVGVPLGMIGARLLCMQQSKFLNFDIQSFAVPMWVYLLDLGVGIIVPLLAAAYPVWKGTKVSVRTALSDYGVSATSFGTGVIDRMLTNVRGLARPVLLAIRNSFRRRTRLVLTVATLAAGGLFFMAGLNVRASMINTLDKLFEQRKYDLAVSFSSAVPMEALNRAVRNTPGIARAEGWNAREGGITEVPVDSQLIKPYIVEGRWFRQGDTDAVVVNTGMARRDPQLHAKAIGVVREPFVRAAAYMPLRSNMVNSLRVALLNDSEIHRVEAALEQSLLAEGLRPTGSHSTANSRIGFDQHMVMIYVLLVVVSSIILGVGALGLMTTMSLNVLERRREMGILRAIGATRAMVWIIVAAEGAVIGLLSWVIAAIAAWPVSKITGDALVSLMFKGGLDFVFEVPGLLIWFAVAVGLGMLASAVPAWHASCGEVREALMYE